MLVKSINESFPQQYLSRSRRAQFTQLELKKSHIKINNFCFHNITEEGRVKLEFLIVSNMEKTTTTTIATKKDN